MRKLAFIVCLLFVVLVAGADDANSSSSQATTQQIDNPHPSDLTASDVTASDVTTSDVTYETSEPDFIKLLADKNLSSAASESDTIVPGPFVWQPILEFLKRKTAEIKKKIESRAAVVSVSLIK